MSTFYDYNYIYVIIQTCLFDIYDSFANYFE